MGRYAFFNTHLEYKFRFGVQPSSDIRTFGGRICYEKYDGGYFFHEWEQKDRDYVLRELEGLRLWLAEEPLDFAKFPKTLDGTHELRDTLYDLYQGNNHSEELLARYILGSCIYHQLLYMDKLEVHYEGWN